MHTEIFLKQFAPLASGPGGVQKLRELVLNLAILGKLSNRMQSDGHAVELLEKAAESINQVLVSREIRSSKFFGRPPIVEPVKSIPPTWIWTTLGNLGVISPRNGAEDQTLAGFVPMAAIAASLRTAHSFEERPWSDIKSGYTHIADGDVVLAKITPCFENGKSAVIEKLPNGIGAATTELHVFRQYAEIVEPRYLLAFLKSASFIEGGVPLMTGTAGQKRIPTDYFALCPFPLPPLAEQKRLVAKIDELMALCDELEARQEKATGLKRATVISVLHDLSEAKMPNETADRWARIGSHFDELFDDLETIKQLRKGILHLAAYGCLTEQRPEDGLASDLLAQIKISRTMLLDAGEPTKNEAIAQKRKQEDQKIPNGLRRLPVGWSWATLMQCSRWVVDCRNKTAPYSVSGAPLLRTNNIRDGKLNLDDIKFVNSATYERWTDRYRPGANDLVITREAPMGEVCLLDAHNAYCLGQRLMLASLIENTIEPKFLLYSLQDPELMERVQDKPVGSTVKHLRVGGIETLLIPVAPLEEQRRIVAKVDELMALCDRLEERVCDGEKLNSALMSSLIHTFAEYGPGDGDARGLPDALAGFTEKVTTFGKAQETPTDVNDRSSGTSNLSQVKQNGYQGEPRLSRPAEVDDKVKEAILVSAIVKAFFDAGGEPIGNFRLQKAVYFARRYNGEHALNREFARKAAGPYNPSMKYSGGIAIAKQKNWLREARGRYGFGHVPGKAAPEVDEWIKAYDYGKISRWVAEQFRFKKNEDWEMLATVDYAIEHMRSLGIEPEANQVLDYIRADYEWHAKIEKLGLTEFSIQSAIVEIKALFEA
ncbi:hypothetical protein ELI49_29185 (plasmid) [Rhizobium ruizarguesonis]|uniref:restriction endonuclease subunit S n=1 Tax=Rhizobium ruizarguesonis TaxID=2081791 RepID=UPI0010316073|nr:restriction endonuclease subunit S [Rhizobium ruizarguesonis]TAT97834.1 hypothetical protein ELI49_29185 [Rhizobium ruizarguesonis]